MCSRFALSAPADAVQALFRTEPIAPFPPRYNIAPTEPVHIIRRDGAGRTVCALVRWGLIPSWVKDPRSFTTLINARSETAREKPSFRGALRHKRCLFPVTAFYEWSGPAGRKVPHMFSLRGGGLFAFAGLYEDWLGADGSELETAAILTTTANATVAQIHDRMPVILPEHQFVSWLDCKSVDAREAHAMLLPAPDALLNAVEVDRRLNNPRHDGPELQTPVRTTLL
ncbi:MAG: SOS response-associated peptidase [Hyphomicrobiaceae bacterium]